MTISRSNVPKLSRRAMLAGAAMALLGPARTAPAAAERVVLTVDGLVSSGSPTRLTLAEIEALGLTSFTTRTPWYTEPCRFEGVRLDRLMAAVGGTGRTLRVEALNDYAADIPVSDFAEFRPILATRRDGAPMPIADKGPLFVVYPFDDLPSARHHAVFSRSVWQVRRVEFR